MSDDGIRWKPVAPPALPSYEPVSQIDAMAGLVECSICAAVVLADSRPEHDQWHRSIAPPPPARPTYDPYPDSPTSSWHDR